VLVGAGIMSATLGVLLKELNPGLTLEVVELRESGAMESSNPWNNAGTGHAALCELNYTPEGADGSIDIKKSVSINAQFEESKQFWAYLIEKGAINAPKTFINPVPHMSFVRGNSGIAFLKKRFEALRQHHAFAEMEYTEDRATIAEWAPLLIPGRDANEPLAMTRVQAGTDVNFGEITRQLIDSLIGKEQASLHLEHEVRDLKRNDDGTWRVTVADLAKGGAEQSINARFVFIGAGGGALKLLQKSGIEEAKGYAGFPVGGQFLMTRNQDVVAQHLAKVYGKASVGSPPMSVPHLDTRVIDGENVLLFGPFATFSTKYLKNGSLLDMFSSMTTDNFMPMVNAGIDNWSLSTYLMGQLMLSQEDRMASLREYFPQAQDADWELINAGQRVQIIKKDPKKGGILQFGTELVAAADGTIAALLGASPGASVTVSIMLDLIRRCFPEQAKSDDWRSKLDQIFPAMADVLSSDAARYHEVQTQSNQRLQLDIPSA
jgi:malate dehydrogenase (quinone)